MRALGCTSRVASRAVAILSRDIKCVSRRVPILVPMFLFVLKVCFVYFVFIGYDEEIRKDFANFTALSNHFYVSITYCKIVYSSSNRNRGVQ